MTFVILFLATGLIFLVLDSVMLAVVLHPLFEAHLGDGLLERPRLVPAAIFYLLYLAGVLHFVSLPAFRAGAPVAALTEGALLGLLAYGTFELTSHAVMRDWSVSLVAADMAWGAALTGISAWGGVMIARALR